MKLSKRQGEFLHDIIDDWEAAGTLPPETAEHLRGSFTVRPFDWKRLALYSFWFAIASTVIAVGVTLADKQLVAWIQGLFFSSDLALCLFFAAASVLLYAGALWRRRKSPQSVFSNEALIFTGVLLTAVSLTFLGRTVYGGQDHFSPMFLFAALVYAGLAFWFPSRLVWVFALLALGSWFGTETGYASGWGAYFLGMNYPLRFTLFGAVLVGLAFVFRRIHWLHDFFGPTYVMGLLYLFVSLWILSIFGNYGDMHTWEAVKQWQLLPFGIVFGVVALAAIVYGLRADDGTSRGFGITFLFINLYTKYFEFFWNGTHKALFFIVLAVSFAAVGRWAEKIWTLGFLRREKDSPYRNEP